MSQPLVLACGALVSELRAVLAASGIAEHVEVRYLPANLHNRPERIVPALTELIDPEREVLIGYADCGTGGAIDSLLATLPNARRLPGDHCYEFFTGTDRFRELAGAELGTFYLTDFLAKHFEALVWQGLGLDQHPQLRDMYFGNYTRVLLLTQSDDPAVVEAGQRAAEILGLRFEHEHVGLHQFHEAVGLSIRKVA
ncbi:MAG: DUF1638 domain-containing protein [Actinomycetota bacterium]